MYFSKYQFLYIILVISLQFFYIVVGDYNGYQASLLRTDVPQNTKSFVKPYYHSSNEYEQRNHEFWYENKPMPHYHGSVPIIIHQHFTEDENFIDDNSYVTDPPGFSLKKHKQETYQKLSNNKNIKPQYPKIKLSGSETFDGKEQTTQKTTYNNKLTKSEEKLLKEIEDEIAMEEKTGGKKSNIVVEDTKNSGENKKNGKVSAEMEKEFAKFPPGTQPDPLPHLPKVPQPSNTYFGDEEKESKGTFENKGKNGKEYKGTFENHGEIGKEYKGTFENHGEIGKEYKGTFENHGEIGKEYKGTFENHGEIGKEHKGTFENHGEIWKEHKGTFENHGETGKEFKGSYESKGKKGKEFKSVFENEVDIIEKDMDKNKGPDYMDDLDKMSTGDVEKIPTTTARYTSIEKISGNDYDLISNNNRKPTYGKEEDEEYYTSGKNKLPSHNRKGKTYEKITVEEKLYTSDNDFPTPYMEKIKSLEKTTENEEYNPSYTKGSGKKKCCACCSSAVRPQIGSPRQEFIQQIQGPQGPVLVSQTGYIPQIPSSLPSSRIPSPPSTPYIPTGAELAARYGVPYPSMVSQGQSCGSPSIPCAPIPYIPPPCCIAPPPKCCLPTIPCCPKIQIPCCPQTPICCQPNLLQLQEPRTTCGTCKSKTMIKLRSKRNTCLPCKKRSKRSDLFETIYRDVDHHHRVKRLGCIPCLQRRVKRTPLNSNCKTCFGNGNTRSKRTINCTLCRGGTSVGRSKRDAFYDSPGYDNVFDCDKSCCDYSKCDELTAKPLKSKKKFN
uniref:BURP domain-containing protein n=1 Tax=Strongyloides papillosus TaxID=174720 RepID=A0A0N5B9M1_STREA